MIRIEHLALWTHNLEGLAAFYAEAFGAAVGPRYENPNQGCASSIRGTLPAIIKRQTI